MRLVRFLAKRLMHAAFVLIGLSILIFLIARVMPGNPARMAMGPRAPQWAIEKLEKQMYLDRPLPIQYFYWFKSAISGDFGDSLVTKRSVSEDIIEYFPASLELAIYAAVFMGIAGVVLGTVSGWFANTWIDNLVRVIAYIGIVTPSFVFAIFFVLIFSYWLELFPTIGRLSSGIDGPPVITGMVTLDALITGNPAAFWDGLKHIFLPAVSLAMGPMAQEARITRSSLADNAGKDFIAAERACGIPERTIMFKYLLKPSLIPTISIYGLDFASLMGNAFLIELIFNWPGLSRYGMNAILQKDLNAVIAAIMVFGVVFVIVNIAIDLAVERLDPRIRFRTGG
ncbi:MAG: ABC transporter permease [Desulfobacteraceae bacterium]|nr:ABC transporter permease [Desulfobacteraceae bacterium]